MKKCLFLLFLILFFHKFLSSQTFTDEASNLGIFHVYNYAFNGAGITFCDFDLDGNDDMLIPSYAGERIAIFKNNITSFQNVTSQYNITSIYESKNILVADYDNDGDRDIFITNVRGKLKLYQNVGQNFVDVSIQSGITNDTVNATAAMWFDYNKDGLLDLYTGVYSGYMNNIPRSNRLYKNTGNGLLQDVTSATNTGNMGNKVLALAVIDYNNDTWPDIYIASDRRIGNNMLKNNGNGTFTDVSAQTNTNFELDAMGLAIGDYDNNGYFDIYISNGQEGNVFLKNNGNGTFTNVAIQLGMTVNRICWGNNFFDYDNDGDLDIYICVSGGSPDRKNVLFKNNGNGTFTQVTNAGLNDNFQSYGCAIGDYDNNGYIDIATLNEGENVSLWKNSGGSNKWIKIKLQGTYSNWEGIGSLISVYRNGTKFNRYVNCGQSYCSQNSLIQTYGVGNVNTIDSIVVVWPSGAVSSVPFVNVNQTITIIEPNPIGIGSNHNETVDGFLLHQNYPNPFNPSTIINYDLSENSFVNLVIYDAAGRVIMKLVSEFKAQGEYSFMLDEKLTSNLSAGVYFYKLTAGKYSNTKKLVLVK